jgi:haloacetate dehalogenase
LIQPAPMPETLIQADPHLYLRGRMARGEIGLQPFTPEAWAEYERCFDHATIHASCEDYRAAASIDLEHDRIDRAAEQKLEMPVLLLWGQKGAIERCFHPLQDWAEVAVNVHGHALPCGHYLPEEAPDQVCAAFLEFFDP